MCEIPRRPTIFFRLPLKWMQTPAKMDCFLKMATVIMERNCCTDEIQAVIESIFGTLQKVNILNTF